MPPKSSVWGHKLRGMEPTRQRMLWDAFREKAVAEYQFKLASLSIGSKNGVQRAGAAAIVEHFKQLLGLSPLSGSYFPTLNEDQFEVCLKELEAPTSPLSQAHIILTQNVSVTRWKILGDSHGTESLFGLQYGSHPCVSTFLTFTSIEQFRYIQGVLAELKFFRLNEKHLKESRASRRT